MRLGLHINEMTWRPRTGGLRASLGEIVDAAEAAGFDAIAFADHVWLSPWIGGPLGNHLEAYTSLGFIAARTKRVRLLALATAAPYRPAGLLAKIVTTLDVLSDGRAMLGIGSGDYPEEARGLGLPFPAKATDRFDLLEETVRACLEMWSDDHGSERAIDGAHVKMERALNIPQALSRPHPPILIAGGGQKRTLPLVARYADACNLPPSPQFRGCWTSCVSCARPKNGTSTRSSARRHSALTSAPTARTSTSWSASCAGSATWEYRRSSGR